MSGNPYTQSNLMRHLMNNIQDNIYFMDREGRIILINDAGAKWLGYDSTEEVIGKTDLDIFTTEHGRAAYEDEQRIMRTGEPILGIEEKETRKDGKDTWVSTSKMPLLNEAGKIVGVFGISRDITSHKEAELRAAKYAEENRQFRIVLEDDLRMAGELQKTFFPTVYPVFSDGGPASEGQVEFHHINHSSGMVGGDFCSVRKLGKNRAGLLLCDVMGHGVRAALGTAIVRAVVEEISNHDMDPGQFLMHMNKVLTPILRQDDQFIFSTACYMVLDVSTGLLRYALAGHPSPIILNNASWNAETLAGSPAGIGPALAVDEFAAYQTMERMLAPGDCVFMYTDGIYEVEGRDHTEFGEERLIAIAQKNQRRPLKELFSILLHEAQAFSANGVLDDDVCLAGFRLKGLLSD